MWMVDRLVNLVTGLGTGKDKGTGGTHVVVVRSKTELDAAYRDNWIAKKAIDIVPFDMLREGRHWQGEKDQITAIEKAEKSLGLIGKVKAALIRGRLYGGGCIFIGDGSADPTQELKIESIGVGGIKYLHVFSMHEIVAGELERDPLSPYFGEPREYEIRSANGESRKIHPSRIVRFFGAPLPDDVVARSETIWSDSILQAILDSVDQATSTNAYIAAMVPEAKQDIISIPGLSQHLATADTTKRLTERFSYASMMKSIHGMLLLEGDGKSPSGEVYQQKQLSFAGLPDVANLFLQIVSGAADVPVTRMLGQAPRGLNSTGESDLRNYYDHVAAKQNVELTPSLERLDRALIRHALGSEPDGVWYEWRPLYQPSETEKADILAKRAKGVKDLADTGLIPDQAFARGVQNMFMEDGTFPGLDAALEEFGDEPDDKDEEAARLNEEQQRQQANDAAPRTLYVSRKLLNADEFLAWAKGQGFETTLEADDLHVTVAFSREPVDWMKVGENWTSGPDGKLTVVPGGARLVEHLGDKGAVVLLFNSTELAWRHMAIREAGASWDWQDYQPHVSITYQGTDVDLSKVEPYRGKLVFGPEIFAEVNEDWAGKRQS